MSDTTTGEIGSQMAPSDTICHFLRIPKEIRLEIYRYLLLPSSVVYISPDEPSEPTIHDRIADSEDNPEASLDGKKNKKGVVVYNTRPLSGDIEPHIFAKFQKISFDAYFDDDHTQPLEMWIDDDTHVVREEDVTAFRKIFRGSNLIKDFVKILSNSPRITRLEIALEVEVLANSNLIMADLMEESDDEDNEAEDKMEKIMDIANEKATELLLESGIMEPLKTLSNVSYCDLKFGFEHREEGDEYKPPVKYVQMLKDMKETIESNFKEQVVGV